MADWFNCRGACGGGANPTSDTVKIDPSLLNAGKENVQPLRPPSPQEQAQKAYEAQKRAEATSRQRVEAGSKEPSQAPGNLKATEDLKPTREVRSAAEEVWEAKRRRDEELARRQQEEKVAEQCAAAERALAEAAERAAVEDSGAEREAAERQDAERAAEEKARQDREDVERTQARAEARAAAEREDALDASKVRLAEWCMKNGFKDMHTPKRGFMGMGCSKFPLHTAVANKEADIVQMMVNLGVDKEIQNSRGQTAEDLARKMNKNGSMDDVIASFKNNL